MHIGFVYIHRYRLENNIKIDLSEIGWGDLDWLRLVLDGDH
jgi:hypothetical protein